MVRDWLLWLCFQRVVASRGTKIAGGSQSEVRCFKPNLFGTCKYELKRWRMKYWVISSINALLTTQKFNDLWRRSVSWYVSHVVLAFMLYFGKRNSSPPSSPQLTWCFAFLAMLILLAPKIRRTFFRGDRVCNFCWHLWHLRNFYCAPLMQSWREFLF